MAKYFQLSTIIFSFFLVSCSGSSSQFIEEDYKNGNQSGSLSVLTIQKNEFNQHFSDHSFGKLQGNESQLFEDFLTSFSNGVTNEAEGELTLTNSTGFEIREFETDQESFSAITPSEGESLGNGDKKSRFVIILDQYRFQQYEKVEGGGTTYAGHEKKVVKRVNFKTNYVIWDNNVGNAVAWGLVEADKKVSKSKIEETYNEILSESFNKMIKQSPFSEQV